MAVEIKAGNTSNIRYVMLLDAVTGAPKTGLTITDIDMQYTIEGSTPTAKVNVTELALTNSAWAASKMKEINSISSPGLYRADWLDSAFALASVGKRVYLVITEASIHPAVEEIILTADDMADLRDEFDADPITCSDVTGAVASVTADVSADMTKIGGNSVAGNLATLTLKQLDIQNSAGTALIAKSTGGAGHGAELEGQGAGEGLSAKGGADSGHGILGLGGGTGSGLAIVGGATGSGIKAQGGATSGDGIECSVTSGAEIDANITGDITGSLSGSVGSVTGAVGSLGATAKSDVQTEADAALANYDGPTKAEMDTAHGLLATPAQVATEMLDALRNDVQAELSAIPAANASIADKINLMFEILKNKLTNDGSTQELFKDDSSTSLGTQVVSEAAGTVTRAKMS